MWIENLIVFFNENDMSPFWKSNNSSPTGIHPWKQSMDIRNQEIKKPRNQAIKTFNKQEIEASKQENETILGEALQKCKGDGDGVQYPVK